MSAIDVFEVLARFLRFATQHHAVRVEEVLYRFALAQELRIGHHCKLFAGRPGCQLALDPAIGSHRDRRLGDDYLECVQIIGN